MRKDRVPGYKKIAGELRKRIRQGRYQSGDYLPSENQLAGEFEVTRTTVRKALEILKYQGTIESFQGKGYQVKSLFWEQSLLQFYSFGRSIADNIPSPATELISLEQVEGLRDVKPFAAVLLQKITRLRLTNGKPLILETSHIPAEFLKGIDTSSFKQVSLYDLLEEREVHIIKAKEFLEPALPNKEEQTLLQVKEDTPLFKTLRYTYDTEGQLVELRESLIRGDYFRFSVEMSL